MCGIVGMIGTDKANETVLEGLRRLEYRGYDSCGIGYVTPEGIKLVKSIDRINDLKENVKEESAIALGHTRWATHGGVNLENAHPHTTEDKKLTIIHNGVIENYLELKEEYGKDINFKSQTDTEVLLYVLQKLKKEYGSFEQAIPKFMEIVHGSYAVILYDVDAPDSLYILKYKSPMLIGKGKDFMTISSDPSAVIDKTKEMYQVEDYKFARLTKDSVDLYNKEGKKEEIEYEIFDLDYEEITTKEYETFMHKEIEEQPKALRNIVENYQTLGFDQELQQELKSAKRISIIACGTSYHAGLVGRRLLEDKLKIPVEVLIASEYGYEEKIIGEGTFFIFLSQSGETADSMLVFNQIKDKYPTLAITNTRGSQLDRNAKYSLLIFAGMEIAVASTKAYTAQIAVLAALAYVTAGDQSIYEKLLTIADYQEKVIAKAEEIKKYAQELKDYREVFYLGRLTDYDVTEEAALKIKEITYLNVNSMASGELKHGTIALIDENKYIMSIISNPKIAPNSRSNIEEVRSRNGKVVIFSTTSCAKEGDDFVVEYEGDENLAALVTILPHQYLSLYTAQALDLDIDKPRNLAKAVTVE